MRLVLHAACKLGGWVGGLVGGGFYFLECILCMVQGKMLWGNPDCTIPSHIGRASQRGKDPRPNCIVSEFFVRFWHIVGQGYFNTIKDSIVVGKFSKGVTKEVITLIFKTGDKRWVRELVPHLILERSLQELCQSIVTVKIYAKALHCHLQPLLMEVINSDHYAFLPLRYILDNVFLTRETIDKVRCFKQDSILLKLEFANKVTMEFA